MVCAAHISTRSPVVAAQIPVVLAQDGGGLFDVQSDSTIPGFDDYFEMITKDLDGGATFAKTLARVLLAQLESMDRDALEVAEVLEVATSLKKLSRSSALNLMTVTNVIGKPQLLTYWWPRPTVDLLTTSWSRAGC